MTSPAFSTVMVANRGEIACRVIRTLKSMGIRSVAVYSDADAGARHVLEADVAVNIGPAPATESYLRIDAIIGACLRTGAQAVHPGYGFLAENVEFAKALDAAGIVFIGPGIEAIEVMGDKIRSKNHVMAYGVPCVPGVARPGLSDQELVDAAPEVGFPLLIKPSAGGGGKGMQVVERQEDLAATLGRARRVAASAFGDDTLFLERLVAAPRHIEVQVLADHYGNVIHLGERECSLQRRHQKVIEEAPSPLLESLANGAEIRARIGEAACNAARSVNYGGAGTVEFLVSDADPEHFYFMEMNTRLQVEHPVTELVIGVDLVEWQVRIAAGERLTVSQSDVVLKGHAAEARIYAEVPERNFLPSVGEVLLLAERSLRDTETPYAGATEHGTQDANIRIDSAMLEGLTVTGDYDPMLAKVIAWAPDRRVSLDRLDAALGRYTLLGLDTNVEYLRLLVNDDDVRAGRLDTGLIERKLPGLHFRQPGEAELIAAAAYCLQALSSRPDESPLNAQSPWNRKDGWRLGAHAPVKTTFGLPDGTMASVSLAASVSRAIEGMVPSGRRGQGAGFTGSVDGGSPHEAALLAAQGPPSGGVPAADGAGLFFLELDGVRQQVAIAAPSPGSTAPGSTALGRRQPHHRDGSMGPSLPSEVWLGSDGWACRLQVLDRKARLERVLAGIRREEGAADPEIRSPMPGTVVSVSAANGDAVQAGQVLLSVEAMKMEHQLVASVAGTVHLGVKKGDLVKADQVLATIHVTEEPESAPQNSAPPERARKDKEA